MDIFKLIGVVGLLIISVGIIVRNEKTQNILFIFGSLGLEAYSIYIRDTIFIILQIIFILTAAIELVVISRKNRKGASS